jgi:hypothetical protein
MVPGIKATVGNKISSTFAVKKLADKPSKQINVGRMSLSKLAAVKQDDAFMYYSIPEVMKAALKCREIALSSLKTEDCNSRYKRMTMPA